MEPIDVLKSTLSQLRSTVAFVEGEIARLEGTPTEEPAPTYPTEPASTFGYVNEGDSLTEGYGVTPTYPDYLATQSNLTTINLGVSGRRLREMDETFESRSVAGHFASDGTNTLVLFGGANELIHEASTTTLAMLQASMNSYVHKAKMVGYRVFVCTLPTTVRYDSATNTLRNNFNTWIKNTLAADIAGVVDLAAIPEFADHTNRTYFLSDGIHFTAAAYEIVATAVREATGVALYVAPVSGDVELIENGTFDSNLNGWSLYNGQGSMTWENGRLVFDPSSTGQGPVQIIDTIPGETYQCGIALDYVGGSRGVSINFNGVAQAYTDGVLTDALLPNTFNFAYTATSDKTEVFIRNGGSGTDGIIYVDNVSVVGKKGGTAPAEPEPEPAGLPRVFISTDLKMDSPEKDDAQSLIHALMYQDKYNIVGIAATASKWGIQDGRHSDIIRILDAYELDQAKLRAHSLAFKLAADLKAVSYQGATAIAPAAGYSSPTASSQAIIAAAKDAQAAGTVLNVLTWGGETDAAQALHDDPTIAPYIRLFTINKQDDAAQDYIRANFINSLDMWVDDFVTYGGVWRTNVNSHLIPDFHRDHAQGHGALGNLFYEMSFDLHGYEGTKMGDSPTIFRFLNGNQDDPTQTSWGGRYRQITGQPSTYYTDLMGDETARDTIRIHRSAWLADFQARFDWLL